MGVPFAVALHGCAAYRVFQRLPGLLARVDQPRSQRPDEPGWTVHQPAAEKIQAPHAFEALQAKRERPEAPAGTDRDRDGPIRHPSDPFGAAENGAIHRLNECFSGLGDKTDQRPHRLVEKARRISQPDPLVTGDGFGRLETQPKRQRHRVRLAVDDLHAVFRHQPGQAIFQTGRCVGGGLDCRFCHVGGEPPALPGHLKIMVVPPQENRFCELKCRVNTSIELYGIGPQPSCTGRRQFSCNGKGRIPSPSGGSLAPSRPAELR